MKKLVQASGGIVAAALGFVFVCGLLGACVLPGQDDALNQYKDSLTGKGGGGEDGGSGGGGGGGGEGEGITYPSHTLAEKLTWLAANATEGLDYTITLDGNERIAPSDLYYDDNHVTIRLNGDSTDRIVTLLTNGALLTVGANVTLILGNNVTLKGSSSNNSSLVKVNQNGTLIMNGGTITGNNVNSGHGGGVYVSGIFSMNNGTISNNTVSSYYNYWGGGVFVANNGTFTMSGGKISGNTAGYGGGVGCADGTFTKESTGGIIYGLGATDALKNTANNNTDGHAVHCKPLIRRDATVSASTYLHYNPSSGGAGDWM